MRPEYLADLVDKFFDAAISPFSARLAALESRGLPERGADGQRGEKGERGLPGEPGERGLQGPPGEKGMDGQPGMPGKDGRDGIDGKDGAPGKDGRDGVDGPRGEKGEPGSAGRDGVDGKDGVAGKDGRDGIDGEKGDKGDPGRSITIEDIAPLIAAKVAEIALDVERRLGPLVQAAVDRIPRPRDGADGMGFDDLDVLYDGERTFTFRLQRGDRIKEFAFRMPATIDRNGWKAGAYQRGDVVSCGGDMWIAQNDTELKPGGNSDWRLAVRKGRDGKDGANGKDGDRGPPGPKGRDLTQLGADGSKWS